MLNNTNRPATRAATTQCSATTVPAGHYRHNPEECGQLVSVDRTTHSRRWRGQVVESHTYTFYIEDDGHQRRRKDFCTCGERLRMAGLVPVNAAREQAA